MLKKVRYLLRLRDATKSFLVAATALQQLSAEYVALGYGSVNAIDASVLESEEAIQYSMSNLTPAEIQNMLGTITALTNLLNSGHATNAYKITLD